MNQPHKYDAIVVGSGPNGLAAAIRLAQEGYSVKIVEAKTTIGGGTRTLELTEPGFKHDICSAIHPMAASSPFLGSLPLDKYGLEWIQPEFPLAHPMDNGPAIIQYRQLARMKEELGEDYDTYKNLFGPLAESWNDLTQDLLAPLGIPSHPGLMTRFGIHALQSAAGLGRRKFKGNRTKALFGGLAAHSIMPLNKPVTSAIGLVLGAAAHSVGWPLPRGGSQRIADSMVEYLTSIGGEIETEFNVENFQDLPPARAVLFDLSPKQVLSIAGDRFPVSYKKQLRKYRYGAGVFKIDYILKEPVPWADPRCSRAGTVHIGGEFEEIAKSENEMSNGLHSEKPYVLVAQQSLFDNSRTPDSRHTLWAYCHVPNGSTRDMTQPIEKQVERFAPGFRDIIDIRRTMTAASFESYNANYIGGDINGGVQDLRQLFCRPASPFNPYATPADGIYFCSASTPPGGGVHGMCGYHAAELVLKREFGWKSKA